MCIYMAQGATKLLDIKVWGLKKDLTICFDPHICMGRQAGFYFIFQTSNFDLRQF